MNLIAAFSLGFGCGSLFIAYIAWHTRRALERETKAMQAKIDELMIEYCPEEMSEAQWEEYGRHQRPVVGCTFCSSPYYACTKCPVCGKKGLGHG